MITDIKFPVTRNSDLISLVNLTKIVAEKDRMTIGEAFDYIDTIISYSEESDDTCLFDTLVHGLPLQISERGDALCNLLNSQWWKSQKGELETVHIKTKNGRDETPAKHIAIRKTEASKLFNVPLDHMNIALMVLNGIPNPFGEAVKSKMTTVIVDQTTPTLPPLFNTTADNYPPELAIALQAWQAVSTTEGKGKPKARIRSWLDDNTKLSNEAKDRISVVCNWDKLGGATRSD